MRFCIGALSRSRALPVPKQIAELLATNTEERYLQLTCFDRCAGAEPWFPTRCGHVVAAAQVDFAFCPIAKKRTGATARVLASTTSRWRAPRTSARVLADLMQRGSVAQRRAICPQTQTASLRVDLSQLYAGRLKTGRWPGTSPAKRQRPAADQPAALYDTRANCTPTTTAVAARDVDPAASLAGQMETRPSQLLAPHLLLGARIFSEQLHRPAARPSPEYAKAIQLQPTNQTALLTVGRSVSRAESQRRTAAAAPADWSNTPRTWGSARLAATIASRACHGTAAATAACRVEARTDDRPSKSIPSTLSASLVRLALFRERTSDVAVAAPSISNRRSGRSCPQIVSRPRSTKGCYKSLILRR